MNQELEKHFLDVGTYTYAGPYQDYYKHLPDDIEELSRLVCSQIIHRITLKQGNTGANAKQIYGDMTRFPWYRMRCEDDVFLTAVSMTAELFRRDERGFCMDRKTEDKIVLCCRYVSVLMSAILKAKGIPCRCRAGFAPYIKQGISMDHWINQYWNKEQKRWVTFDADSLWEKGDMEFNPYDIPSEKFDWAATTWLNIRHGETDGERFIYADTLGTNSLEAVARYLMYDFHAMMNHELTFSFLPSFLDQKFKTLSEAEFRELDELAEYLADPDGNFKKLQYIWKTNKKFRIINSPLVGDQSNGFPECIL